MTARSLRIELPAPHPAQAQVLAEAKRYNVLVMGRRWGKTTLGIRLVKKAVAERAPMGWFAPTYKLLDEAWREVVRVYGPVITRKDTTTRRIEFIGGGSIDFWTLKDGDAGRGRKYALVVIDEAAIAPNLEEVWAAAIRPTLTDLRGEAWFLSTPKGKNYFYRLFQEATRPGWARWQMPTSSNPFIPADELEEARKTLPSIAFQQEYLAQFVEGSGALIRREWIRVGDPPAGLEVYVGVDLAISQKEDADYTALVALGQEKDGRVWVLDVLRARATFHETLQLISSFAAKWKPRVVAVEAAQYQAALVQELLRTTRLPVKGVKPDRDKVARAAPLIARYEQGLVWHAPTLPREFEEELVAFPLGEHDDMVDALAYAYMGPGLYTGLSYEEQRRHAWR